jgi:hypothetical protein
MYFDRAGQPIELERWAELWSKDEYRFLARDVVGNVTVITIWTGVDPMCAATDEPCTAPIFETGVVPIDKLKRIDVRREYVTEAAALAGHRAVVDELRGIRGEEPCKS